MGLGGGREEKKLELGRQTTDLLDGFGHDTVVSHRALLRTPYIARNQPGQIFAWVALAPMA